MTLEQIQETSKRMSLSTVPENLINEQTKFYINPTGRFVIGGPQGDAGCWDVKSLLIRMVAMRRHGGGCFSGKDPTKSDRSAAYAARYVAKILLQQV